MAGAPQHADEEPGFIERQILGQVRSLAPWLVPIIERGPLNWLADKVTDGLRALVDSAMAPVRAITATITEVRDHVGRVISWMVEIGGQLARGDCSGLTAAAEKVQRVAEALASPAIDKIKAIAAKVGDFFSRLWADYGAPAWEWLQKAAGAAWESVKSFASRVWSATAPVRRFIGSAWSWLMRKLGVETSPEDEGGLLDWIKRKAAEAWDRIRAKLEPYKKQLAIVAGVLLLLTPAGPIVAAGAAAKGLVEAARWIARVFAPPGGLVPERRTLAEQIAPTVRRLTSALSGAVTRAAAFLVDKLTGVLTGLRGAAGSLGDSLLSFLVSVANWLLERFQELAGWAADKVNGLAELVGSGLAKISEWLKPVLRVMDRVGSVLENVLEVMILLAERAWNAIPACIRDPVTDFLVEHLLKKIPILKEILEVPDVWARIKDLARTVIRRIFRGGLDLLGAALEIFKFLLDVLKVPVELVVSVFRKAGAAISTIVDKPVQFLKNLLRGLAQGFRGFWSNALKYLGEGVIGWLVGQLPAGVRAPIPFTPANVFGFVLDVLGITVERVWRVIQRNVTPPVYTALRAAGRALATAWDWLQTALDEGVGGLWRRFTERLGELTKKVISSIAGFLFEKIVEKAAIKLLSMLDPTGIMAVVNSILFVYDTVRSAIEYAARILQIVDDYLTSILDIASGAVEGAAKRIERLLASGVPVAIGFLANILGISKLANRVREAIADLQEWVESGVERLVKAAVKIGGAVAARIGKLLGRGLPSHRFKETSGTEHVISFPLTGDEPTVASSDPRPVLEFIETYKIKGKTDVAAAKAAVAGIRARVKKLDATPKPSEQETLKLQEEIVEQEKILAGILKPIFEKRATLIAEGRYDLEGLTGPYKSMQFPGDKMDADHQPSNLILLEISNLDAAVPAGRAGRRPKLFTGRRLVEIAADRAALGYTILLGRQRHKYGRTYGGKSRRVADHAVVAATAAAEKTPDDPDAQRRAVIAVLRAEMEEDVKETLSVLAKTEAWDDIAASEADKQALVRDIRQQIKAGARQVQRQPLDSYAL